LFIIKITGERYVDTSDIFSSNESNYEVIIFGGKCRDSLVVFDVYANNIDANTSTSDDIEYDKYLMTITFNYVSSTVRLKTYSIYYKSIA